MKLSKQQRSQALAWRMVMGFELNELARHFGLSKFEIALELNLARQEREQAGKSPEPIPVVPPAGQERATHSDVLLETVKALESILWTLENFKPQAGINESRHIATRALKKVGVIL